MLCVNQFMLQRWGAAAIWGAIGLGLVLAGALSSEATLTHRTIGVVLQVVLWNVGFVACIAAVAISVDPGTSSLIGISMPYIAALWLLVLGVRFAGRRGTIIAIAAFASLLLLFQCLIFGAGILLSPDNLRRRTESQLSLAAVAVTGGVFVWWFVRAKLARLKARA